VDDLI